MSRKHPSNRGLVATALAAVALMGCEPTPHSAPTVRTEAGAEVVNRPAAAEVVPVPVALRSTERREAEADRGGLIVPRVPGDFGAGCYLAGYSGTRRGGHALILDASGRTIGDLMLGGPPMWNEPDAPGTIVMTGTDKPVLECSRGIVIRLLPDSEPTPLRPE